MTDAAATPTPAPVDRDALKARAKDLGVEHARNVTNERLAELVAEAEALEAATAPTPNTDAAATPTPAADTQADTSGTPNAPDAASELASTVDTNDDTATPTVEVTTPGTDATPSADPIGPVVELPLSPGDADSLAEPIAAPVVLVDGEPAANVVQVEVASRFVTIYLTDDATPADSTALLRAASVTLPNGVVLDEFSSRSASTKAPVRVMLHSRQIADA